MPEPQPQQPAQPPLLRELTPEGFQLWRHNPVTRLFLTFLADKAQDLQDQALALLLSDSLDEATTRELRGRIWCLRELQELNLDDIRRLYGAATAEEAKAKP